MKTTTSTPKVWTDALQRLREELPAFVVESWIRPLRAEEDNTKLRLVCPNPFYKERVQHRYLKSIQNAIEPTAYQVELTIAEKTKTKQRCPLPTPATPTHQVTPTAKAQTSISISRPGKSEPKQTAFPYSFDAFVIGPSNALAREAAYALANQQSVQVSPLFLVAESGMGKTHLARAAATQARRGGARVVYTGAERFTTELLGAIHSNRTRTFRERFRENCDLLVIDDVDFLQGKSATQLELFHTLEHLCDAGQRVLLTGSQLPREMPKLDSRLCSRLGSGLVAPIEAPDSMMRRSILRNKAAAGGVHLPENCLDLMVDHLRGSVRDLEAVLVQLVSSAALLKRQIDEELTQTAMRKLIPELEANQVVLHPVDIVRIVAAFFGGSIEDLASRSRKRDVLRKRQIAMYLCRRYTTASAKEIGRLLGRDHSAVLNAESIIERLILERAPLRYQIEALAARIDERLSGTNVSA